MYSIESIVVQIATQTFINFLFRLCKRFSYFVTKLIGALLSLTNKTKIIMSESKGGSASRKKKDSSKTTGALDSDTWAKW